MRLFVSSPVFKVYLVVTGIILAASLAGIYMTFTIPITIEEPVAVLNYEHQGEFDYVARQTAAYLFDDLPLETEAETVEAEETPEPTPGPPPAPSSTPKYPSEIASRFEMLFTYELVPEQKNLVTTVTEEVEVKADMVRDGKREEVVLVPKIAKMERFTVVFSLDASDLAASPTTTITANVYTTIDTQDDLIFESFTQSLTIRSNGPLLEVDKNLPKTERASYGKYSYEQTGEFHYIVHLKPASPWGAINIQPPSFEPPPPPPPEPPPPPPAPPPLSAKTFGPEDMIYTKLFDSMDITFSYFFQADKPVSQIMEDVQINAVLENPGVWTKTFVLVPHTEKSGPFAVTFALNNDDFNHVRNVYETIASETGVSVPHNLIIKADVRTVAETDFGLIDEDFSQTLSTTLGGDTLEWTEELAHSQLGTIEKIRMIPNPERFVGLSLSEARIVFPTMTGIFSVAFLGLLALYVRYRPKQVPYLDEAALRARKKYKGAIVDVEELPQAEASQMVVSFTSLDELVRAADTLFKPVLHKVEPEKHTYCIIDGLTRYQYVLGYTEEEPASHA